jgi:protease-4
MKSRDTLLITGIIAVPVVIGILLSAAEMSRGGGEPLLGAQGKKIGLVTIADIIYSSDPYAGQLRDFLKDNSVAGVVLRIDSPGGLVAPSQEIYGEVLRYRSAGKPLVVSMGNVAASGGYYIASPARRIFANAGTITGSIGVIIRVPHYYKLLDKIGIDIQNIKSGRYKDIGSPHREMSGAELKLFQGVIDDTHERFISDICAARGMNADSVLELADGRIFTGNQAIEAGLVDTLGGLEDAMSYLKNLTGLPEKARVVEKSQRGKWLEELVGGRISALFPAGRKAFCPLGAYYLFE